MIRRFLLVSTLALGLAGCAGLKDAFLGSREPTPSNPEGKSIAQSAGEALESSGILGPWGELVLATIIAAQNAYLARKKLQARKAASA